MTPSEKLAVCRSVCEECVQEAELLHLLEHQPDVVAYDGFEPSGRMHIAQGVLKALNVNKLTSCGIKFKFWIADWFAQLNNKLGGDLDTIQLVGRYFIEIWKALGMDMHRVSFLLASEKINARPTEYWELVMDIARRNKLKRVVRCTQIMGRTEHDDLSAAQIMYPIMQTADIFFIGADICQLGMDQRKVNMLAREYCDACTPKRRKPVILSHSMLPGLLEGQTKMSKSDSKSAVFMDDSEKEVIAKINKAFCPPRQVDGNPCLAYVRHIVLPWFGKFEVGAKTYTWDEVVAEYENGTLHPGDLKPALAKHLNAILQPVRDHFDADPAARDLLARVRQIR